MAIWVEMTIRLTSPTSSALAPTLATPIRKPAYGIGTFNWNLAFHWFVIACRYWGDFGSNNEDVREDVREGGGAYR